MNFQRTVPAISGDDLKIGEDLDERVAKIRKRLGTDPEAERDLAEAIFHKIDRLSEAPKRAPKPRKVADRSRQLLRDDVVATPEEIDILSSPHEILVVHGADGRIREAVLGGPSSVSIPTALPDGAILTHNHPTGRGPSASDIKAVLSRPGVRLRVIVKNERGKVELFDLRLEEAMEDTDIDAFTKAYELQSLEGGDTHPARRRALALISDLIGASFRVLNGEF
jgi:hypothetical protein